MSYKIQIPEGYKPLLGLKDTEKAIKLIKDFFELNLSSELRLRRVTAPLFVLQGTGINDDLNGIERPVSFPIKCMNEQRAEVVHSLAKWKRLMLADYDIQPGFGLYTDMNAIRPDEDLDNLHSLYVDQWDWEQSISIEDRNLDYLKDVVARIYNVIKRSEYFLYEHFPQLVPVLPQRITFIHAEDLLDQYPELSVKEREKKAAEKYGAIFVIGIGANLKNGEPHDGRAPDYDDWTTPTEKGHKGLNGDIIIWNPILKLAHEVSSMGIRVNKEAMLLQLSLRKSEERKKLYFHKRLLNDELPLSIGGGIGQSRLSMLLLRKAHIGEIQASIWPEEMITECKAKGILLV